MRQRHLSGILIAVLACLATALVAPPAHAATTASFTKTQDWGSGFEGRITVTNANPTSLATWTVEITLPAGYSVTSSWDSQRTSSGQQHTFRPPSWAGPLAPNASFSFGFNGSPGNFPGLASCRVNGANCDGSGGGQVPGTPTNLRGTPTASTVALSWSAASGSVSGYHVYRNGTRVASPSSTSYTDSGLAGSTQYSYQVSAFNAAGEGPRSATIQVTTMPGGGPGPGPATKRAAPYLFLGWGNPPAPQTVMNATGTRWFTMAFILSSGGCNAAWDGNRPLAGGVDAQAIAQIRAAGGDVMPSIGGWSGNKLGPNCSTPQALAGAYQQVINAYGLKAIDIDIENFDEFENATVQDRILQALQIVKRNNPGVQTIVTFPTTRTGPSATGNRLIERAQALGANIDIFTLMPFDFGSSNIFQDTVNSSTALNAKLMQVFGWSSATAYAHQGISGMNGLSDQQEMTSLATWTQIRDWARARGMARLAFWAVNRDRPCPGGGVVSHCSGIAQPDWEFSRITAGF